MDRDLADDVGGGAEAVDPEPRGVAGELEGAVADQAGAEERRGLEVRIGVREGEAEALVGDDQLGVAAVPVVARELRPVAEVLAARAAEAALAVGPAEPGHPHPLAGSEALAAFEHARDDLVSRHERELRPVELAVHDVQVGAADAACDDLEERVARTRLGNGEVGRPERAARGIEDHGAHWGKATRGVASLR
jgi:hypothetical protein